MDTQTQAQIYLADQRGQSEAEAFRSCHTFNFGSYTAEGREPFGALYLLNDDTLRPGASLHMQVEQPTNIVLLPIVGGLDYASEGEIHFLEPGQAGALSLAAGMTYTVYNPYPSEFINCLQIWFANSSGSSLATSRQINFDLTTPNTLLPFYGNVDSQTAEQTGYSGFIGRFAGREEGPTPLGQWLKGKPDAFSLSCCRAYSRSPIDSFTKKTA